ncbi:MAK10-like protein [Tanacetum coccineum]
MFRGAKPFPNKPAASRYEDWTQETKEPELTLEDEFQDLHLNLPVLEVLAHALIYNAMLDKYVESLELVKKRISICPGRNLGAYVNIIPLYLFKKLNIGLLEETNHIFRLADGTESYPIGVVRDVEVHIGRLKLLTEFYIINMKKDPKTPLLVGRGFLTTANAVIDYRKAKITVGEGTTRLVFGVKGIELGQEKAPYWTILGKGESYKPRPSSDGVGARTPYYARKDFLDCYLPEEWEIARDSKINPFKDVLEYEDLIRNSINWDKQPKNGDGAWHAKISLIDPDGEELTKALQSVPT